MKDSTVVWILAIGVGAYLFINWVGSNMFSISGQSIPPGSPSYIPPPLVPPSIPPSSPVIATGPAQVQIPRLFPIQNRISMPIAQTVVRSAQRATI